MYELQAVHWKYLVMLEWCEKHTNLKRLTFLVQLTLLDCMALFKGVMN